MESEKQPNVYKHERTRVQIFFMNLVITAANSVIDAWDNLPTSVIFTSLPAFRRTIRSAGFRIKKNEIVLLI